MANFVLDNTANDINTAITKVLNPDTTLTGALSNDPSLITSGAVKLYVDNEISALNTRLTSAEASITAMQNAVIGTAVYTATNSRSENSYAVPWTPPSQAYNQIQASISSDNKTITLNKGSYLIDINGLIQEYSDNNNGDYWTVALEQDGSAITPSVSVNDGFTVVALSVGTVVTQNTADFRFEATEIDSAGQFVAGPNSSGPLVMIIKKIG